MAEKVVILGGGVAGLSAAHELIERGYEVEVYERQLIAGGKARSIPVMQGEEDHGSKERHIKALEAWVRTRGFDLAPGARRPWLPGEHGFRFFPNFYRHITDVMARTPFGDAGATCYDNLLPTSEVLVSQYDRPGIVVPERFPRNLSEAASALKTAAYTISPRDPIPFDEVEHFIACMWRIATSCKERRFDEYERIGWWDFIGAEERSEAYRKFLAIGLTRSLVAAKARDASTKTVGDIAIQLQLGIATPQPQGNRLLNGPTNLVWIQPWMRHLASLGVRFQFGAEATAIECRGGRVVSATVQDATGPRKVTADWFVAALPVERMAPLVTRAMTDIDPGLARLAPLSAHVQWMNGIQFYLTRDAPLTDGHVIFIDSEWALTAVSQRQYWRELDFAKWGDGLTRGLLSVDISEWDQPGMNGKAARDCTREEIAAEVWAQLKRSLNVDGETALRDEDLHYWFLDPDISADPDDPRREANVEPLLVNGVDTWRLRPDAATRIPNFFLASDYVRTFTDLATMEGANEAARRAVNAILRRGGSKAEPCRIWNLHEPDVLKPLRAYDSARYHAGLPWDERFAVAVEAALRMGQDAAGMPAGGEGSLAALAPLSVPLSMPDGPFDDPAVAAALRMIAAPPELFDLVPAALSDEAFPVPVSGVAHDLAPAAAALLARDAGRAATPRAGAAAVPDPAGTPPAPARPGRRLVITQKA